MENLNENGVNNQEITNEEIVHAVQSSQESSRRNALTDVSVEEVIAIMQIRPSDMTKEQTKIYKRVLFIAWNERGRVHIKKCENKFHKWSTDFGKYTDPKHITESLGQKIKLMPKKTVEQIVTQAAIIAENLPVATITSKNLFNQIATFKASCPPDKKNQFFNELAQAKIDDGSLSRERVFEIARKYVRIVVAIPAKNEKSVEIPVTEEVHEEVTETINA